jgi:hypothetical protein
MNRSTNHITLNSRAGVVFAALPVRRRRSVASDRLLVKLARRIFRPFVVKMTVERRPLRADQGRPRGGAPGSLDGAHYDLLRQFR